MHTWPLVIPCRLYAATDKAGARALLRQYFVGDDRVHWTTPTNLPVVLDLVHRCPIVIHTLAAADAVREHAPPTAQTIDAGALRHIRVAVLLLELDKLLKHFFPPRADGIPLETNFV